MTIGEILQTAGVSGVVSAVLFAFADFWKPFFVSYLGKKGERLANAEDIEKILTEFVLSLRRLKRSKLKSLPTLGKDKPC